MFDPVTIALVAAGAVSTYGTLKAGHDAKVAGENQQTIANYNAQVAEQEGQAAKQKAEYDAKIHADKVRSFLSMQRAEYGKSGIEASAGSPLLVMEDTVKKGKLDELAIKYGGDVAEINKRSEAGGLRMGGSLYKQAGKNAQTASYYQAGSSLLSSGAKVYGAYKYGSGG